MKKILVLGSKGLLGQAFCRVLREQYQSYEVHTHSRSKDSNINCDIVREFDMLSEYIIRIKPDYIINCVALVSIQGCENKRSLSKLINSDFVGKITVLCNKIGAKLVQISTDHFYSGDKRKLHSEQDPVKIINRYAETKYLGERNALSNSKSLVIRTNITGFKCASESPTFFEWVLKIIKTQQPVTLFDDFFTSTIDALSLSTHVIELIKKEASGIFNIASSNCLSKKEFILSVADCLNIRLRNADIGSVSSLQPERAESLGLQVDKVEMRLGCRMPTQQEVINTLIGQASIYGVKLP